MFDHIEEMLNTQIYGSLHIEDILTDASQKLQKINLLYGLKRHISRNCLKSQCYITFFYKFVLSILIIEMASFNS